MIGELINAFIGFESGKIGAAIFYGRLAMRDETGVIQGHECVISSCSVAWMII